MTLIGIPKKVVYLWYRQQNLVFVQKYALILVACYCLHLSFVSRLDYALWFHSFLL